MSSTRTALTSVLLVFTGVLALVGGGCQKGDKSDRKAGEGKAPVLAVNGTCPIMGKAINPAQVPASLTREFKGQTIGFCCPMCPPAWDKLSDAERQAKLDVVMKAAPSATQPHEHSHEQDHSH